MATIKLTREQYEYLRGAEFLSIEQKRSLSRKAVESSRNVSVEVSIGLVGEIRDSLGIRLQTAGFGGDDEPNEEGKMLEDLIDAFFIRVAE